MQHRTRAIWIMVFLACGFTLISFNLIQIQLVQHAKFTQMAIKNHMDLVTIPARRGSLRDIDGEILAQTQRVYDVRLDCQNLARNHPEINLPKIAEALQLPVDSIAYNPRNRYQLIAHDVDDAAASRVGALKLQSVIVDERDHRSYPNNELAAHILGYTDDDGRGMLGMEKELDSYLRGTPGQREVERDGRRKEIPAYMQSETPAVDGDDVTLTIKTAIQHVVEDQLDQIAQTYSPEAAYIIVMDPQTGEIMAMGSRPTYDPNNRADLKPEKVRNRCITDAVEPGSIFKIITLAGALNEGLVNLSTQIFCENGDFYYGGKELRDDEPHGWLPVEEVMAQSSNIGFAKIALGFLHEERLYKYATGFGIGQRTGLFDQQGESAGLLRPLNKWSAISITRIPMGQEVLASPIQLVTAMSVIANGGKLMEPQLARQVTDPNGKVVKIFQPHVVRQVITAAAARAVAEALHQVTVDGTAKGVHITDASGAGWSFAGKTGTAQKFVNGEYSHTQHVSSFIGFMPAEDPAFVALVMVDDPKTAARHDYGAEVSAPVFANVAKQIAQIMNIPPDLPAPPAPPVLSSNTPTHARL
jgi:cell division protein FtsI (penicillin-binding protein 3)/stage V sporulation protein D (sporulation-specific penicillin-binding protein)